MMVPATCCGAIYPATVASFDVSQGASSVTSQTISSTSDVNVTDMVISVPPGVYMIWFSSDIINGNNSNSCTVTIYTNGTANSATERTFGGMVEKHGFSNGRRNCYRNCTNGNKGKSKSRQQQRHFLQTKPHGLEDWLNQLAFNKPLTPNA